MYSAATEAASSKFVLLIFGRVEAVLKNMTAQYLSSTSVYLLPKGVLWLGKLTQAVSPALLTVVVAV